MGRVEERERKRFVNKIKRRVEEVGRGRGMMRSSGEMEGTGKGDKRGG